MPEVQGSAVGRGSPNAEDHREARAQARGEGGGWGEHPHPNSHFMASIHLPTHEHASTLTSSAPLPPSLPPHPSIYASVFPLTRPSTHRTLHAHPDSGHVAPAAPGPARQASACLSIPASVYSPHDYFPVHLPLVPLCIHRSIHQSIHYPSVLPSTHPPTQPPVHHPSIYPSVIHSSIHNLSVAHLPIPQTVTEHLLGAGVGDDSKAGLVLGGRPHEGECAPFQSRASRGEIAHFMCTPTRTATPLTPESTPRGHGTGRSA